MRNIPTWVILIAVIIVYAVCRQFFAPKLTPTVPEGNAEINIIDVGQGDSILIRTPKGTVLIDAGTNDSEEALKKYLDDRDVRDIDYAVFTHPHEDHIGGADMIMKNYNVKNVILPDAVHPTTSYEKMMKAIEKSDAEVYRAVPDDVYEIDGLRLTVLAPISDEYERLNDYSVVIRADYGKTSFLFTGDAEVVSESEMIERYGETLLDCDFLKVGHHGSYSSSSLDFLRAVSPKIAAISCGKDNPYGYPHRETTANLGKLGIEVYRTDLSGSLVFVSDGKTITPQK